MRSRATSSHQRPGQREAGPGQNPRHGGWCGKPTGSKNFDWRAQQRQVANEKKLGAK